MGMTRQEFIDDVTSWSELLDFCYEYSCPECDDIVSEDAYDDEINERLYERARDDNWWEVKDWLNDLPTGNDYYDRYNDCGVDDDFECYKDDVLHWADNYGDVWEDEEDEEEDEDMELEEGADEEDEEELEEIDFDGFFEEDFADIRATYLRPEPPQPQKTEEPEDPPVFGAIDEVLNICNL